MLSPSPGRQRSEPRPERDWGTVAFAALLVLLLAGLGVALAWLYSSTLILPGVETMGISIGGKSRRAATALLGQAWEGRRIALADGEQTGTAAVSDLGLTLDAEATVDAALALGHWSAHLRALFRGPAPLHIAPVVRVDDDAARRYLGQLAPHLAVPPADARLQIVAGRAEVVPAAPGRALDVQATAAWLATHVGQVVSQGQLPLTFLAVPPVVADLDALAEEANVWLASALPILAHDPVADESLWWTAPPEVWGTWVTPDVSPGPPPALHWTPDLAAVRTYLAGRAEALSSDRYIQMDDAVQAVEGAMFAQNRQVVLQVFHYPGQHVVQYGETLASIARDHGFPYPWLQQANPGVDALSPGQVLTIPSPDVLLPLPVVAHKRIVISISQQRMWAYAWGEQVWAWTVSTGIASSPTSPGVFQVQSHEANAYASSWDLWMPYFIGIYRPVPTSSFMNGLHGFPTRDGATLLWTGNLGYPVTYGCILLSTANAQALYDWAETGVVVEIRP